MGLIGWAYGSTPALVNPPTCQQTILVAMTSLTLDPASVLLVLVSAEGAGGCTASPSFINLYHILRHSQWIDAPSQVIIVAITTHRPIELINYCYH